LLAKHGLKSNSFCAVDGERGQAIITNVNTVTLRAYLNNLAAQFQSQKTNGATVPLQCNSTIIGGKTALLFSHSNDILKFVSTNQYH